MAKPLMSFILNDEDCIRYSDNELTIEELKLRYIALRNAFHCEIKLTTSEGEEVVILTYP
jgi:hypothetical protein